MKLVAPEYYNEFRCIADRCRHSCCVGWEIDIDENTYMFYKGIEGGFGDTLKESISDDETPHFILDQRERCPHLNECGLCNIALTTNTKGGFKI